MRDTILIVEDDEMICQGIVDALQLRNWKTDVAATCEEAEKKIKEYTYMLYILDMKLPDGNGISLCRKIRTATENPVLFLSAYDNESYIVEGLEAGGDDYVVKPFRTLELLARIKSLLSLNRGEASLSEMLIPDNYVLHGKRLFELDIPEDAVIAAIFRDDKLIIPRGNAQIMSGDKILVIAKDRIIHELSESLKLK